ncbi:MAG: CDP-diacylglycerol--glycerol-3-phosphate 3-phosphatidyltransferase [Candidatus Omnitrophota bacterium]
MNTPNKLTLSRIVLVFVFMFFIFSHGLIYKLFALIIFTIASLTDLYDGKLARKMHQESDFGRFMDPIADKFLVLAAFLVFVEMKIIPAWMVILIISRELMITGIRLFALTKKVVLASARGGKHKTVSQMFTIFVILGFLVFKEAFKNARFWSASVESATSWALLILMAITTILTLTSGFSFLWNNRALFVDYERKNNQAG